MKVCIKELDFQKHFEDVYFGETFIHDDYLYLKVKSFNIHDELEPLAINLETNSVEDIEWCDLCIPVKTKIVLDD